MFSGCHAGVQTAWLRQSLVGILVRSSSPYSVQIILDCFKLSNVIYPCCSCLPNSALTTFFEK